MEGVRRTQGQPKRKAKALRLEHIAQMVNHLRQLPDTKKKQRDIALVLTGFFGAFRRSELVAIQRVGRHPGKIRQSWPNLLFLLKISETSF